MCTLKTFWWISQNAEKAPLYFNADSPKTSNNDMNKANNIDSNKNSDKDN